MTPHENPSRRHVLKAASAIAAGVLLDGAAHYAPALAADIPAPRHPMRLSPGPQLFIDDALVAETKNLTHTLHAPRRLPHPLIRGADSPDRCGQPYVTVLYDDAMRKFRMWYNATAEGRRGSLAYLESTDGVDWDRPHRVLLPINGYGASILDAGPQYPEPSRRFKYAYWEQLDTGHHTQSKAIGLCVAFSPDGIEWTKFKRNPVLPDLWQFSPEADAKHVGDPRFKQTASDIVDVTYDPARKRYIAAIKSYTQPPTEFGPVSRTYEFGRRLVSQSTSEDFVNWTTPRRIIIPDERDQGDTEFYGMAMVPRGDTLVGFVRVLRDDVEHGVGYSTLATSRDGGVTWHRLRKPFFENRASDAGAFDHAVAWLSRPLRVGDELFFYYGGYNKGHKAFTDRQLGLAKLRYDGFASWDAASTGGILRTPPVLIDSKQLTLNADVAGELRVRLVDITGKPLAEMDWTDCTPMRGDSLAHAVRWRGDLGSAQRAPVSIEFSLRDARLYAFTLSNQKA